MTRPNVEKKTNKTSLVLLALLSIRPLTTYELAQQMGRTLRWFWPRAESVLYEESKRLVARGLATSTRTYTGRRASTLYQIEEKGRDALRQWFDEPSSGMTVEYEALAKVAFGELGTKSQLLRTIGDIKEEAISRRTEVEQRGHEYLTTGGPYPDRLPIISITHKFLLEQSLFLERWSHWAETVVSEWPGVTVEDGAHMPEAAFVRGWELSE